MANTLDLVGFSGNRIYTQLSAGFTPTQYMDALVSGLTEVGWEKLSGPTVQTFGNGYIFRSQQSPWYDTDNIPEWYVGNRIYLVIDNSISADFPAFFVGADLDGTVDVLSTSRLIYSYGEGSGFGYNMLFNPYQLVMWSDRHPSASNNSSRYSTVLISALNLPKFVQQKNAIVHSIIASNYIRPNGLLGTGAGGTGGSNFVIYKEKGSSVKSSTSLSAFFLINCGGVTKSNLSGCRLWNITDDPSMSDYTTWSPFYLPARIMYTTPGDSDAKIQGFLWDALLISEGYSLNSIIKFNTQFGVTVNFKCHSGRSLVTQTERDGTLWFCITPKVVV